MAEEKTKRGEAPNSLFWPLLLIVAGVIWLLGNAGIISSANLAALLRMWPLILIAIGLDLLVTRERPQLRLLLGLGTAALLIAIALFGPALGLASGANVETHSYSEPLDNAQRAQIQVDAASASVQVSRGTSSTQLVVANIRDDGIINFNAEGDTTKSISLDKRGSGAFLFDTGLGNRYWNLSLTDSIPLVLDFNLASGSAQLNLSGLKLDQVNIDSGSGSVDLQLPDSETGYELHSSHASGSWSVSLADRASLEWVIASLGSGSLSVDLPSQLGVHLEVQSSGSGSLGLPSNWKQLNGDEKSGVWESSNFAGADYHANITIQSRGSGSVSF